MDLLFSLFHEYSLQSQVEAPDMEPLPVTDFKLDLLMPKVLNTIQTFHNTIYQCLFLGADHV